MAPRCQGITRGEPRRPCGQMALRGGRFCRFHGGLLGAAQAESERFGRPVLIIRRPRAHAQAKLGVEMAWPDAIPKRPDLLALGPLARGRLFEAWMNREMDPATWKHELTRERFRKQAKITT